MSTSSFVNEVDERQLRYLYEVAVHGGVRAAADKIGINASAVSRQLAQLEARLDMVLIERHGRGITLTEIGLHLVGFYRERLRRQQELVIQLQEFRQLKRGHITVGVGEEYIERLLERALCDFSEHYPDIVVDVRCGSTAEIIEMVREGLVDMGLCTGANEVDLMLRIRSFRGATLSAIVSINHSLAGQKTVTVQELKQHRLIFMSEHFGVQRYLNAIAQKEQTHLSPSYRCNMFTAAQAIAATGLGVAFMSSDDTRHSPDSRQVVAIPIDHPIANEFSSQLICRTGRRMTPAARNLWRQLEAGMKMSK